MNHRIGVNLRKILRTLFLSLFLFSLINSCQHLFTENDKRLYVYLNKFKNLCSLYKKDCSGYDNYKYVIEPLNEGIFSLFKEKNVKTIGRCNRVSKKISIDEKFFKSATNLEIEMVVLHEVGHCVFNMNHLDKYPSIMNSYSTSYYIYRSFYGYFINEFFKCKKGCPNLKFDENFYKK